MSKKLTEEEKLFILRSIWDSNDFDCNHSIEVLNSHSWEELQSDPKLHRYPFPFTIDKWNKHVIEEFKMCQSISRKFHENK